MKEKNLREILEKCSKAELVKVVLEASARTRATFSWMKIIGEIRLGEIETKIDANLAEGKKLTNKFSEMAKHPQNYTDDDVLKFRIALARNRKEWKRLNDKYDKISKELYE